ncbi:UDP-N-acetylmuramate dehydrogenase [Advenella mimigardefordensis]|uniref:UDP-N-acetylenolpyruvoylglucosamine reductase n=1 Tax=Advenella mimigardefordensis (strain DSM 17166 / LMG 22922 / DPN7) TaxID=1247726 RepID=W0PCQ1_ADVMD|nr:UDP-N-acetylmuramate dehydrogenase [Advenella mimigardefordensis]AHG63242.1 UDP-N-acetylenolpyruvoylglucosamine reductase [Advenella mimigardefordensis DPN7]
MRDDTSQDLTGLNTLGLVSHAAHYFRLDSERQLPAITQWQQRAGVPIYVLGGGSNLILREHLSRPVLHNVLKGIRLVEETSDAFIVEAAGGEVWHDFVGACIRHGWYGLENLALIPGTVGACPVQNIGAYGVEVMDRIESVQTWDLAQGQPRLFTAQECAFSYRDSIFKKPLGQGYLITAVRFRLPKQWVPVTSYPDLKNDPELAQGATPQKIFDAVCRIRQAKLPDPAKIGNAGSFFKNPIVSAAKLSQLKTDYPALVSYLQADGSYKLAAGWMIEQSGWKGRSLGPVGMHQRQALVLVNHGGATAADVLALADAVVASVRQKFDVTLEREPVLFD